MLKTAATGLIATGVLILVAGCGPKTPPPTINASMTQVIAPSAQTIWDITNHAYNEEGTAEDPSKIKPTDWAKLEAAAQQIEDRANVLAKIKAPVVKDKGAQIEGEDDPAEPNSKQVQANIDRDVKGFNDQAKVLAKNADIVLKAAQKKDAKPIFEVANRLDSVCDGCHARYWDPKAPQLPD